MSCRYTWVGKMGRRILKGGNKEKMILGYEIEQEGIIRRK